MTDYTQLIERLRLAARNDSMFGDDVREHASEQAAQAIEALQAQVAELEAQPTARTYMDGYSDGKQWALEEAAKVCDEHAQLCEREHGHTTMFGGVRADNAKGLASEIRRLKEGL